MGATDVFDSLSSELSPGERQELISSIEEMLKKDELSAQPSDVPLEDSEPPALEDRLKQLSMLERVILFLSTLFSGESREKIVTTWVLRTMSARLQRTLGKSADLRRRIFREPFLDELKLLQTAAAGLVPALEVLREDRNRLITEMAGELFPEVHDDLLRRTSREALRDIPEENERTLKKSVLEQLERCLRDIDTRSATEMRTAISQIEQLGRLAEFPLPKMVSSFSANSVDSSLICPADYLQRSLEVLTQELNALPAHIHPVVISTAVLVGAQDTVETDRAASMDVLSRQVQLISGSVSVFRSFARRVPLLLLVRVLKGDPWWEPAAIDSGNEWISLYRASFQERIARQVLQVSLNRQGRIQIQVLEEIIDGVCLPFPGLPDDPEGFRSRHRHLATIIYSFTKRMWRDSIPPLRILLTTGDFYKSSNRAQYNDVFSSYDSIPGRVDQMEQLLCSPEGWGGVFQEQSLQTDEDPQRLKIAMDRIDGEMESLVHDFRLTLEMMVNLLGGILYSRPGSSFDTIANYSQIGGRRNAEYLEELRDLYARFQRLTGVIGEIDALERRALENGLYMTFGT